MTHLRVIDGGEQPEDLADLGIRAQHAAEAHLQACQEALWSEESGDGEVMESPAWGPFCGCDTCIVREVLSAAWDILMEATEEERKDPA